MQFNVTTKYHNPQIIQTRTNMTFCSQKKTASSVAQRLAEGFTRQEKDGLDYFTKEIVNPHNQHKTIKMIIKKGEDIIKQMFYEYDKNGELIEYMCVK